MCLNQEKGAMFELVLNDQNEIERVDVLRTEVNIHREEDPEPSEPEQSEPSSDESDGSGGGYWMPDSPPGGIWYNGDDYVNGEYVGDHWW